MLIMAVRTYEPWGITTVLGGLLLSALVVAVLIFALRRGNR